MKKRLFILFLVISLFIPIKAYALSSKDDDYTRYDFRDILNDSWSSDEAGVNYGIRTGMLYISTGSTYSTNFITEYYENRLPGYWGGEPNVLNSIGVGAVSKLPNQKFIVHNIHDRAYEDFDPTQQSAFDDPQCEQDPQCSFHKTMYRTFYLNTSYSWSLIKPQFYIPSDAFVRSYNDSNHSIAVPNNVVIHNESEINAHTVVDDGVISISDFVNVGLGISYRLSSVGKIMCTNCITVSNNQVSIDITSKGDYETVYVALKMSDYPSGLTFSNINIKPHQTLVINIDDDLDGDYTINGPSTYNNSTVTVNLDNTYAERIIYHVSGIYNEDAQADRLLGSNSLLNFDGNHCNDYHKYECLGPIFDDLTVNNMIGVLIAPHHEVISGSAGWIVAPLVTIRNGFTWMYSGSENIEFKIREFIKNDDELIEPQTEEEKHGFEFAIQKYNGSEWETLSTTNNEGSDVILTVPIDDFDETVELNFFKIIQTNNHLDSYLRDDDVLYATVKNLDSYWESDYTRFFYDEIEYYKLNKNAPNCNLNNGDVIDTDGNIQWSCLTALGKYPYFENTTNNDAINEFSFKIEKEVSDGDTSDFPIKITAENFEDYDVDWDYIFEDSFTLKKGNNILEKNTDYIISVIPGSKIVTIVVSISDGETITVEGPSAQYEIEEELDNYGKKIYKPTFYVKYLDGRPRVTAGRYYECEGGREDCEAGAPIISNNKTIYNAIYSDLQDGDTVYIENVLIKSYKELEIKKKYDEDNNTTFNFKLSIDMNGHEDDDDYLSIPGSTNIVSQNLDTTNHKYIVNFNLKNNDSIILYYKEEITYEVEELNSSPYLVLSKSNNDNYETMYDGIIKVNDLDESLTMEILNIDIPGGDPSIEGGVNSITKKVQGGLANTNDKFNFILIYDDNEYLDMLDYKLKKNGVALSSSDYEIINSENISHYQTSEYDSKFATVLTNKCLGTKVCMVIKNIKANDEVTFNLLSEEYSIIEFPGSYNCSFKIDGTNYNSTYTGTDPYCEIEVESGSELEVINIKEGIVPTGKRINSMLYCIMIIMTLSIMVMLFVINKKRRFISLE